MCELSSHIYCLLFHLTFLTSYLSGINKAKQEKEVRDMASDESYLKYVLDLLSDVEQVSSRKMMGEYLLYTNGILFGGIYDNRFMLKDTPAARALLEQPRLESPYPGAKDMILVDTDNPEQIAKTIIAMLSELPAPKSRTKKR